MLARALTGLLLVCVALASPPPPATASGPSVTAEERQFTPASMTLPIGQSLVWGFPTAVVHTSTSDDGFWDSDAQSNGTTFSHTFASSGSYGYHSDYRASMTGVVRVPISTSGSTATGWTLTWATSAATGVFDVQVRKGKAKWKNLATDTSARSATFRRPGTWSVRVRTQVVRDTSSWSPIVKVTTTR